MSEIKFTSIDALSSKDLMEELVNRFPDCIIFGRNDRVMMVNWSGDRTMCLGLCEEMKDVILVDTIDD